MGKLTNDVMDLFRNEPIKPLCNKPPLTRMGGKRKLAKKITGMIDILDYSFYIEPFFGGGRIFFEKQPHWMEMVNDIESRVTNFFYCCKKFPQIMQYEQKLLIKDQNKFFRIYQKYKNAEYLAKMEQEIKDSYEIYENMGKYKESLTIQHATETLVGHAIEFYFFSNMSWRGTISSTMTIFERDKPTETNRMRWRIFRPLGWIGDRMRRTQVMNYDFTKIFKMGLKYKNHTRIWYLDPPYLDTKGYESPFPWEKYVELNECLKQLEPTKDYFILSLNVHPKFDKLFDWCNIETISVVYTLGGNQTKKEEYLITPPWTPRIKKELQLKELSTQRKLM